MCFQTEFSQLCPAAILPYMSVLMSHLAGEAYSMRSAIVWSIAFLIKHLHELTQSEVPKENFEEKQDSSQSIESSDSDEEKEQESEVDEDVASNDEKSERNPKPIFQSTQTRDKLLDILQERVYDVNAFVRSATLKAWLMMIENGAIPVARFRKIATFGVDRLHDKAAIVRKHAIQVLKR